MSDVRGATAVDGDTIEIHSQRIRLYGIDAPESSQLCYQSGKPWRCGQKAAFALADKIGRSSIRCEEKDRDRYKRIVAVCYLGNLDLNAWMVEQGWAMAYRQYSRDYVPQEQRARQAKVGIWASTFTPPWKWRADRRRGSKKSKASARCSDFATWAQAQAYFERAPRSIRKRMDGDGDGIACEALR